MLRFVVCVLALIAVNAQAMEAVEVRGVRSTNPSTTTSETDGRKSCALTMLGTSRNVAMKAAAIWRPGPMIFEDGKATGHLIRNRVSNVSSTPARGPVPNSLTMGDTARAGKTPFVPNRGNKIARVEIAE